MFSALEISNLQQINNILLIYDPHSREMTPNLVDIGDKMTPNSLSQGKTCEGLLFLINAQALIDT